MMHLLPHLSISIDKYHALSDGCVQNGVGVMHAHTGPHSKLAGQEAPAASGFAQSAPQQVS